MASRIADSNATPMAPPSEREKAVPAVATPSCARGTAFCTATSDDGITTPIDSPTMLISTPVTTGCTGDTKARPSSPSGTQAVPISCCGRR